MPLPKLTDQTPDVPQEPGGEVRPKPKAPKATTPDGGGGESKNSKRGRAGAGAADDGQAAPIVDRGTVKKAIQALNRALAATKRVYGRAKDQFEDQEDWPTIVRAAELLLAYGEGRPVERRLEIRATSENYDTQKERMMSSPEGIRFMLAAKAITQTEAEAAFAALKSEVVEQS